MDFILLDFGNPNLQKKVLGGTGKTHNWELSKKIAEQVDVPVFLAGGLNPENVKVAINQVKPFSVDVCSGVRTEKLLSPQKVKSFIQAIIE